METEEQYSQPLKQSLFFEKIKLDWQKFFSRTNQKRMKIHNNRIGDKKQRGKNKLQINPENY